MEGNKVKSKGHHNNNQIHPMEKKRSEILEAAVARKFGDEQSNLLDKFERLAFEVHLDRAMRLGRSLSESSTMLRATPRRLSAAGQPAASFPADGRPLESHVRQGWRRRRPSLKSVLKRLLSPIVGAKKRAEVVVSNNEIGDPLFWKSFSRSMRL